MTEVHTPNTTDPSDGLSNQMRDRVLERLRFGSLEIVLPDGRRFANIDELKKLLLEDKEQIARNLTERLLTYATGAPTRPADRAQVEAILERARARDFGLRSLVHAVVQSEAFRSK